MSYTFAIKGCKLTLLLLALGIVTLGLLAGFVPQREGPEIRRRASLDVAVLHAADLPPGYENFSADMRYAVRRPVNLATALPAQLSGAEDSGRKELIMFLEEGVSLVTVDGPKSMENVEPIYNFAPVLPVDGSPEAPLLAMALPVDYGESLDTSGRPMRWQGLYRRIDPECVDSPASLSPLQTLPALEEALLAALPSLRADDDRTRFRAVRNPAQEPNLRPFDAGDTFSRARRYKSLIEQAAARFGLSLELIYAIIHNESNFAPVLVSSRSAMGLMQLLPSTAGGEVHTFLYGHPGKVSFADLANPETNIRYGAAYLHLLLNRHLAQVRNPISREYCAVAAYNMGPNGFLRLFAADKNTAIEMINHMTPDEVYTRLTQHLPIMETRYFVAKVTRSREEFAAFE